MKGIELIAKEREEQQTKHGFTNQFQLRNPEYYENDQLVKACIFALTGEGWPDNWDSYHKKKIEDKSKIGKLTVAGAFIAAEIDRLNKVE